MKPTCATCNAFTPNPVANPKKGKPRQGWCMAGHPGVVMVMVSNANVLNPGRPQMPMTMGAWPTCNSDQWCREYQNRTEHDDRAITTS